MDRGPTCPTWGVQVTNRIKLAVGALSVLVFTVVAWRMLSIDVRDRDLERRVISTLTGKPQQSWSANLKDIGGEDLERLCAQTPYMTASDFAALVGHQPPGFVSIGDDVNVWWFFYRGGVTRRVIITRQGVMDRSAASRDACGEPGTHELVVTGTGPSQVYELRRK